jgi:hypothetical protein
MDNRLITACSAANRARTLDQYCEALRAIIWAWHGLSPKTTIYDHAAKMSLLFAGFDIENRRSFGAGMDDPSQCWSYDDRRMIITNAEGNDFTIVPRTDEFVDPWEED